jgi:hypothetical protein
MDSVWDDCEIDGDLKKSLNNIVNIVNSSSVSEEETILALERAVKAVRKRLRRSAAENSKQLGVAEVENFKLRCQLQDEKRYSSNLLNKVLSLDPAAAAYISKVTPEILKNRQAKVRKCWIFGKKKFSTVQVFVTIQESTSGGSGALIVTDLLFRAPCDSGGSGSGAIVTSNKTVVSEKLNAKLQLSDDELD